MGRYGELGQRIVELVQDLPPSEVERLAAQLGTLPSSDAGTLSSTIKRSLPPGHDGVREALLGAWARQVPRPTPSELALAVEAAGLADESRRQRQLVELVWSGPAPHMSMLRRTEQALIEVLDRAQREVWLVSFAAYDVPEVKRSLERACARGVHVSLLLESKESSDGKVTFDAADVLKSVMGTGAALFEWPLANRPRNEKGMHGSLHAKSCVADRGTLLVSSANLTAHAFDLNMEFGVLVRGGDLPAQFALHLDWLVESGTIARVEFEP